MKKFTILLCVLMAIALATSIVIGILLVKKTKELNKKTEEIASLESQLKVVRDSSAKKDAKIKELNDSVVKKDNEIKELNQSISKKKAEAKKAEEAKKVAQIGKYQSDDTTGIVDATEDHPMEGLVRGLDVRKCSRDSITFYLEETHGTKIEGMVDEQVTVSLKNGKGSFTCNYGGGMSGRDDLKFKGIVEILSPTQIKITSLGSETNWDNGESHKFTKK